MAQKVRKNGGEQLEPEWAADPSREEFTPEDADPVAFEEESAAHDEETAADAKHSDEARVEDSMGTLALHPELLGDPAETSADRQHTAPELAEAMQKPAETGDAEVMLRLKAGELQCFDYLMNKYRGPIVHFMFRMVHNQGVAEEMAQEVFLRVYRSRETYRAEAKFSTWLYRIATNLAVNHARDTKNERLAPKVQLDEPDPETGSLHDVADLTPTVESNLLRQERMSAIKQHVLALPERQRMAVLMHKYQDMDYKAIGGVLNLSESATKSLLFRAYQTLRERLKEFV
ncbi:MAG: RNA polymerase sigma factor [Janthinobacterium lividum]